VSDSGQQYSASEMERMMRVQDVLLKAMVKKISWVTAAEIIGVTPRTMRRWRERLKEHGYSGLSDRRKGKVSFRRIPMKIAEQVLGLYHEKYFDLNVRHFREKLGDRAQLHLGVSGARRGGASAETAKARAASAAPRAPPAARYVVAHRWEQASLV
jgi:hypothetical protein